MRKKSVNVLKIKRNNANISAEKDVCHSLNASADSITFTSAGTNSNKKRKALDGESSNVLAKKIRSNEGNKCRRWSCDISKKDVGLTVELLEDMGVKILDESSRDSMTLEPTSSQLSNVSTSSSSSHVPTQMHRTSNWIPDEQILYSDKEVPPIGATVTTNDTNSKSSVAQFGVLQNIDVNLLNLTKSANVSEDKNASIIPPSDIDRSEPLRKAMKTKCDHSVYAFKVDPLPDDDFYLFKRIQAPARPRCTGAGFHKLSDEIVLQIFKWLPKFVLVKIVLVCKRWRTLAYDESLWKRLDLSQKALGPGVIGQVISRRSIILRLNMCEISDPIFELPWGWNLPEESMARLQYLDLSLAVISRESLGSLLGKCRHLKKLALENCQVISDEACEQIGNNDNLEVLHLGMSNGLTGKGISFILQGCHKLVELNLSWTGLDSDDLTSFAEHVRPSLQRLNLSGCRDSFFDNQLLHICLKCPNLVELDISDCTKITNDAIKYIVELEYLESLSCSRCYGISTSTYLHIKSSRSITILNIFGILSEKIIKELRRRLAHVEINKFLFSSIARPTVGVRRTSVWGLRVRD